MNAVKRCLALFAATLVVGACGADIPEGGTDLTIRATPGAVWVRNNSSATVNIEAVDKLGGPVEGSWSVGAITGPMTAALDETYQNTTAGALSVKARFVVTPTAEGDGSVQFTGTGGSIVVPVRVAPDTGAFNVTVSDSSPALFQVITATAPAGIVFTPATTVRFYSGPLSRDTANGGLSFPAILSLSADSSQITFVQGPGAAGFARFTALASRSTPGLVSSARAGFAMTAVPSVDTNAFSLTPKFASTGNRTTASIFDTLILVAPTGYRFASTGALVEFFRLVPPATPSTTNPTGYTIVNGTSNPKVISLSANFDTLKVLVAPGSRGRLKVSPMAFDVAPLAQPDGIRHQVRGPAAETFDLRTSIDTSNFAITFSKASPIAEGDTVTATAPTGMVFLPGTVSIHTGGAIAMSGGDSARIALISPDSTKVTFRLPPGASGKFRYSRMARRDHPQIVWQGRSAGTISAAAAPAVVATVLPASGNMNDTITISLDPAGPYRYRPTSQALANGLPSPFAKVSADSLVLKVLPTPGTNAPVTLTNIRYAALPTFQVQANTAVNVAVNAPTSLGPDDIDNSFLFNAPTVSADSTAKGFWDLTTMTDADPSPDCDGGAAAQFYRMRVTVAGSYTVTVNWNVAAGGTDIDMGVMVLDGGYDGGGGCGDYLTTSGLSTAKPEVNSALNLAVGDYVIAVIDYNGTTAAGDAVSIRVRKN